MRRLLCLVGVLLLVTELVAAVIVAREVLRLVATARTMQSELRAGTAAFRGLSLSHLDPAALTTARVHFVAAGADAASLRAAMQRWHWLIAPAERQPAVAAEVRQAAAALAAAADGSRLATTLIDAAQQLAAPSAGGIQATALLDRLRGIQPDLATALVESANLRRELGQVHGGRLERSLQPLLARADQDLPLAQRALQLALLAPAALGADGPASYLVVAQDPADLRPTGGFMGSWGVLTVDHGTITHLDYRGYPQWENVRDPGRAWPVQTAPVQRYMHFCCMAMQDANWYPDFPTTALVLEQFAQADQPAPIAGVIAFDPALVQVLLRVTGPVELPAPRLTVTADNVVDLANYYEDRGPTLPPPGQQLGKQFLVDVAQALAGRLAASPHLNWTALAQAMLPLLTDKHVLVAPNDPDLAAWFAAMGWDGAVTTPAGDYLLLDEMSMSDNKVDLDVARTVEDAVILQQDGSADVTLAITWANHHPRPVDPDATTTALEDFFRVYLPPGTVPRGLDGAQDVWPPTTDSGHVVVSGFVVIPQAAARQVTVRYHVPAALVARPTGPRYTLHVQVQPGIPPPHFHLLVRAPDGRVVLNEQAALTTDRSWQAGLPGAVVPAAVAPPPWDRQCAALRLVAGLLGPESQQRVPVPTACGRP